MLLGHCPKPCSLHRSLASLLDTADASEYDAEAGYHALPAWVGTHAINDVIVSRTTLPSALSVIDVVYVIKDGVTLARLPSGGALLPYARSANGGVVEGTLPRTPVSEFKAEKRASICIGA